MNLIIMNAKAITISPPQMIQKTTVLRLVANTGLILLALLFTPLGFVLTVLLVNNTASWTVEVKALAYVVFISFLLIATAFTWAYMYHSHYRKLQTAQPIGK